MLLGVVAFKNKLKEVEKYFSKLTQTSSFNQFYILERKIKYTIDENFQIVIYLYRPKFYKDFVVREDKNSFLILDGWFFQSLNEDIENINFIESIAKLSGNFRGIVINKSLKQIIIFVDRFSSRPMYYKIDKDFVIFSSNFKFLIPFSKAEFSPYAISDLLFLGHLTGTKTLVKDIGFLEGGSYIKLNIINNSVKINISNYWNPFQYERLDIDYSSAIKHISSLLLEAGKKIFNKSGKHLISISGGLDSRLILYLATKYLKGEQIYSYTFGWHDSLDVKLAFKVKNSLKVKHIFYDFSFSGIEEYIDDSLELNDGLVIYYGFLIGVGFFKDYLNNENFQYVHTGQSGDFIFGSFIRNSKNIVYENSKEIYEELFCRFVKPIFHRELLNLFKDYISIFKESIIEYFDEKRNIINQSKLSTLEDIINIWNLLNRQERAIFNSYRIMEHFIPFTSIFYDYNLFDKVFFLPLDYLKGEKIYIDILKNIFPQELLKIPWEKLGAPIVDTGPILYLKKFKNKILPVIFRRINKHYRNYSMVPFRAWVYSNQHKFKLLNDIVNLPKEIVSEDILRYLSNYESPYDYIILLRLHHIYKVYEKLKSWREIK